MVAEVRRLGVHQLMLTIAWRYHIIIDSWFCETYLHPENMNYVVVCTKTRRSRAVQRVFRNAHTRSQHMETNIVTFQLVTNHDDV